MLNCERILAVPNPLKLHYVKPYRMNKISVSETSDEHFHIFNIYSTPEIDNDSNINHINGDEIDLLLMTKTVLTSLLVRGY